MNALWLYHHGPIASKADWEAVSGSWQICSMEGLRFTTASTFLTTVKRFCDNSEIWFGVKQTENGETSTGYTQKWKEIIELYRRNQWWDKEEVCKDGGAWGRVPVPADLLWHGALKEDNHPGESLRSLWWWLIGKVKMIMISRRIMWEVEDNQDFFLSLELFVQLESSTGD